MLELVDRVNLKFIDCIVNVQVVFRIDILISYIYRGYSLIGKTMNLHFIVLGSIPNISIFSPRSSIGRAMH